MERTIIDWMFEHPWMTFFIAIAAFETAGKVATALIALIFDR